jgi:hypothetical protein
VAKFEVSSCLCVQLSPSENAQTSCGASKLGFLNLQVDYLLDGFAALGGS